MVSSTQYFPGTGYRPDQQSSDAAPDTGCEAGTHGSTAPPPPTTSHEDAIGEHAQRIAALVQAHYALLWRTLRRLGVPEAEVDDALQEVFLIAHKKLDLVGHDQERAFVMGVALRVASTRRRGLRRRRESTHGALADEVDPSPSPLELTERRRARMLLDEILEGMTLKFRSVFVLFELEGLEILEISELLEIPMGTVASRLRRARELFRRAAARYQARGTLPGGAP